MSALSERIIATSAGIPERLKISTRSEVAGARGVGAQIPGTSFDTAMRLCISEILDASQLWQRQAVVRCMWPEKAQSNVQELYDESIQHPERSTMLRARIRLDITSIWLKAPGATPIRFVRVFGVVDTCRQVPLCWHASQCPWHRRGRCLSRHGDVDAGVKPPMT